MTAQAQCARSEAAARGGCDAAGGSMTGGGKRRPRGAAGPDGEQVAVNGRAGRGGKWWCLRGRACARHRPCADRGQRQPPPEVPWPGSELRGPQLRGRRPESAWVPCRSAGPRPPCPLFCSPAALIKAPGTLDPSVSDTGASPATRASPGSPLPLGCAVNTPAREHLLW